jgi:hypothetical protein
VVRITPPSALNPHEQNPWYPLDKDAGWASELVWTQGLEAKSFASAGDRTPIVYSVVRHYTD